MFPPSGHRDLSFNTMRGQYAHKRYSRGMKAHFKSSNYAKDQTV